MKKIFIPIFIFFTTQATAQSLIGGSNILKTNLSGDALRNYNITFERSLNHFSSVSLSYRNMAKSTLPLQPLMKLFIENPAINFDNLQMGNTALTAEARFYLGLSKMSGFYLAPYARSASFDLTIPIDYAYTPASPSSSITLPSVPLSAQLDGTIRSKSYGAYVGIQFQLLTKLVLDLWIIGGHYGTSSGKLEFQAPEGTPKIALDALKKTIDQTKATPFQLQTTVTSTGVSVDTEGPWAGIRGLGVTVGLRF